MSEDKEGWLLDRDFRSRIARVKSEAIEWSLKLGRGCEYGAADGPAKRQGVREADQWLRIAGKNLVFDEPWRVGCRTHLIS